PHAIPEKIIYFTRMADALDGNEYVKNPTPNIATFRANIALLVTAHSQVRTHGASARDDALGVVENNAQSLRFCIEEAVNANPPIAETIAHSCATSIAQSHTPHPRASIWFSL